MLSLASDIKTVMERNFDATNDLICLMNKHVSPSPNIPKIHVNHRATIRKNADTLISVMHTVQDSVEYHNRKWAKELEPDLYKKLSDPDVSFKERFQAAKEAVSTTPAVSATVATFAVIMALKAGYIIVHHVSRLVILRRAAIAGVVFAVLAVGVDAIVSAILVSIEKSKLEAAIDELQEAFDKLKPTSKKYNTDIAKVNIYLETYLDEEPLVTHVE